MKAARKFKKLNQSDVATAIGCSQSALSKMEHNLLVPSAPQWFLFSRFTAIPPETIEMGIIDRHSPVKLNDGTASAGYKLPRRYRTNRSQKVREIYPFLSYLEKNIDNTEFKKLFDSFGIDAEFFLDFDNLINFQMVVDLINFYVRLGKTSLHDIQQVIEIGQNHLYWDTYNEGWQELQGPHEVLADFCRYQPYFQVDFKMKVERVEGVLFISYIPESHVYHFLKDVGVETKNWLNLYRKITLENLIFKSIGVKIEARLVPELSNSPLEAHFAIHD
jgi:transcriptional regulator with XRE-family HTH domain